MADDLDQLTEQIQREEEAAQHQRQREEQMREAEQRQRMEGLLNRDAQFYRELEERGTRFQARATATGRIQPPVYRAIVPPQRFTVGFDIEANVPARPEWRVMEEAPPQPAPPLTPWRGFTLQTDADWDDEIFIRDTEEQVARRAQPAEEAAPPPHDANDFHDWLQMLSVDPENPATVQIILDRVQWIRNNIPGDRVFNLMAWWISHTPEERAAQAAAVGIPAEALPSFIVNAAGNTVLETPPRRIVQLDLTYMATTLHQSAKRSW